MITFIFSLLLPAANACGEEGKPPARTLTINGIYNPGFEWVADATTKPQKYGAYWIGAFAADAGDPTDLVVEEAAYRGTRQQLPSYDPSSLFRGPGNRLHGEP